MTRGESREGYNIYKERRQRHTMLERRRMDVETMSKRKNDLHIQRHFDIVFRLGYYCYFSAST